MISSASRPGAQPLLVALCVIVGYGFFLPFFPLNPNPNETSRLYLTMAVVDDGSVAIDGPMQRYGGVWDRARCGDRFCSDKAPGLSVLAVPAYAAARVGAKAIGTSLSLPASHALVRWGAVILPTAAACAWAFHRLRHRIPSAPLRWLVILAFAYGTPARVYGSLFFGHQTAALLSAAGLLLAHFGSSDPGQRAAWVRWMLPGLLLGFAVATEYPTASSVVAACVMAALAKWPVRRWLAFGAGLALPTGGCLAYNTTAFGHPLSVGYSHLDTEFAALHARGLLGIGLPSAEAALGLLFSMSRGLFVLSPWLVTAPFGMLLLARSPATRPFAAALAVATGSGFLIACSFGHWFGGDCFGPRHLVPIVPLLAMAAVPAIEAASRARGALPRILFSALVGFSILLNDFAAAVFPHYPPDVAQPLRDIALPLWQAGAFSPNLGNLLGLQGVAAIIPFVLGVTAMLVAVALAWPEARVRGDGASKLQWPYLTPIVLAPVLFANFLALGPTTGGEQAAGCVSRVLDEQAAQHGSPPPSAPAARTPGLED